ncbi:MAG: AraC family transcriptional regulator [Pyrinomonadaceae bacterium]
MAEKLLPGRSHGKTIKSLEIAEFIITENIHLANTKLSEHSHENAHFCFVLQGSYSEFHNKREVMCKPSTLTFRPSGELHRDYFHDRDVRVFIIEIPAKWIEKLHDNSLQLNHAANFHDGLLPQLVTRLNREFHQMDMASSLIIEGLTMELLAGTARSSNQYIERTIPHWLRQAKDILHARFSENLTLERIASEVKIHPVHLASVFRQKYHCTVGEYIRQLRIEYACAEISKGKTPLAIIALEAGFANQGHFSSTFKRLTGLTPVSYRNFFRQT